MTTQFLEDDLKRFEGLRLEAYRDSIKGIWTIGYGHTGLLVHEGLVWTEEQADFQLHIDVLRTENEMDDNPDIQGWWRKLDDVRQDALVNMGFNLGVFELSNFNSFLQWMKEGNFPQAALDLRGTMWYKQVGDRAVFVDHEVLTGERPT